MTIITLSSSREILGNFRFFSAANCSSLHSQCIEIRTPQLLQIQAISARAKFGIPACPKHQMRAVKIFRLPVLSSKRENFTTVIKHWEAVIWWGFLPHQINWLIPWRLHANFEPWTRGSRTKISRFTIQVGFRRWAKCYLLASHL